MTFLHFLACHFAKLSFCHFVNLQFPQFSMYLNSKIISIFYVSMYLCLCLFPSLHISLSLNVFPSLHLSMPLHLANFNYPSFCLSKYTYLFLYLIHCLSISPYVLISSLRLSISSYLYLIRPSAHLSISDFCLSISLTLVSLPLIFLSLHLSVSISLRLSVSPNLYLSIFLCLSFSLLFFQSFITHDILRIHWSLITSAFWRQNILEPLHLKCSAPSISGSGSLIGSDSFCTVYELRF